MSLKSLVFGVVAGTAVCVCADSPWPSYELVANGDFESGSVTGAYAENVNSAALPGWTPTAAGKAQANSAYIANGIPVGTYAMFLKTNNGVNSDCYQDVTVPEPGVYKISFQWVARPNYNKQTITVSFSEVVDGEVPAEYVLTTFAATTADALTAYSRTLDVKAAGTYRLKFFGTSPSDSSTAFDNVSVRKIDTLFENGFFDSGSVTLNNGTWSYSNGSGFSNPGWTLNDKCGIAKAGSPWVAGGRPVGEYALFVQSSGNDGVAYQDVTIEKAGLYTLAFDYAGRPGHLNQTATVYFGQIGGGKTDLTDDDLLETFVPTSDVYISYSRPVAVLSAGTYRLKFIGSSSGDTATTYDNVRLFASEELVTNGEFEEGSFKVKETWGAYASFENYSNPGWQVNNPGRVGLGCPFGTWVMTGLEVGKYAMFIQTRDSEGDTTAYQDVAVSAPGTYRVSLNYVARPGQYAGQTIKISFGPLVDGEITNDLINDTFTTTVDNALTPYERYITVETSGTYRLLFTAFSSSTDYATAIDCVSIRRQTEYCFWTGGGDGETISDPANWGRAVISPVDDLCFTNDTALVLSMPADFTASSLNFFGTAAVTVNGVIPGGDATTAKTLTIGKIVSTSAAANTFNCPVAFTTDYNVNSAGPAEFPYGVTAMGWGTVDGAGGLRLSGPTFTFTADTVTISGNATLAAGGKLYAKTLTGVNGQTLTIESGSRVELTGDLIVGDGANGRLYIAMADDTELSVGGTVYAWYDKFTSTRKYGTVWADAITLDVSNNNLGFYAERINLGSGGISFIGATGAVNMDIGGGGAYGAYLFGAYGDWTWADGGKGVTFYTNDVTFDTLDCFDGETAHTVTIEKSFNNTAAKLYKINPGTLVLAASQYFTGGTFLEGGKIVVSAANGSGTGPLTLADGTALEVAEGGILGNSTTTISEGASLTFKAGSGLSGVVTVGGPVTIEGDMTFTGAPSITVPEGASLAIAEGTKITVGDDVPAGTLITGLALTADQLEALFDTPFGAVKLNANGDVVYFNSYMWETYLAGEELYVKYGIAAAANVLIGAACEETDVVRYVESASPSRVASGSTPNSVLTDGDVHLVGRYMVTDSHYEKVYALTSGTFAWTFPATDIDEIAVFSRWGDGGRDGVVVDAIYVKYDGTDWTQIMVSPISVGLGNNSSSQGSICAVLKRADGTPIAKNVTGLKVVFPAGQDNSGAGYAEVAAYASVPKASRAYTWGNATGNKLFSDAGNWTDTVTGAAVGEPGAAFAPTVFDSLTFPAEAEVIVDKSATVYTVALNAGVTLTNPDANTKNTLSFCKLSNDGAGLATVSCGAEFCVKYEVTLQAPVDFAGGASAWSLGTCANAYERTFTGDIEFLDSLGIPDADPTWVVPSGSRLAAPALQKNSSTHVNGEPAFRIEEGAYAHFGSVTAGRDNMYLSVLGEIEVDGLYSVRCCLRGGTEHFAGDFGYAEDVNAAGGTIRAGGLKRLDFDTSDNLADDFAYVYPANLYIGELGIIQDTAERGIAMTGSAKSVYATADFAIRGPDASSGLLLLEADTTFDTQGYTVTWTSGIAGVRTLTKTGDGTLAMSPYAGTSDFTGSIVVNGGTLAIQNDTLTATPVTLAAGTAIAVGANRTVPAAGTLTASGAVQVLVSGDMSEAKVGDSFPLFANCTAESFANLRLDASGLQNLPLRFGAYLKRNADGSVSLGITERGTVITIL